MQNINISAHMSPCCRLLCLHFALGLPDAANEACSGVVARDRQNINRESGLSLKNSFFVCSRIAWQIRIRCMCARGIRRYLQLWDDLYTFLKIYLILYSCWHPVCLSIIIRFINPLRKITFILSYSYFHCCLKEYKIALLQCSFDG